MGLPGWIGIFVCFPIAVAAVIAAADWSVLALARVIDVALETCAASRTKKTRAIHRCDVSRACALGNSTDALGNASVNQKVNINLDP